MCSRFVSVLLRGTLVAVVLALVAFAGQYAFDGGEEAHADHDGSTIHTLAIDVDPEDGDADATAWIPVNTAPDAGTDHDGGVVGAIQTCVQIDNNNVLDAGEDINADIAFIDVVALGVGEDDDLTDSGLATIGFELNYDETVVQVVNASVNSDNDHDFMLAQGPGGNGNFFSGDDAKPDTDGQYQEAVADLGAGQEEGDGILIRIGIEAIAAGPAVVDLTITQVINAIELETGEPSITETLAAIVVVGSVPCPDTDGDNVSDDADACLGTAAGDPVDASGCSDAQVDDDGDGLCDPGAPSGGPSGCTGSDACTGTAEDAVIDASGCSDAQVDEDSDGICGPDAGSGGPSGCTGSDNCPLNANPDQKNTDNDGDGNACDSDDDNDGFSDPDEIAVGSDPLDADSVPEDAILNPDSCSDGIDNDGDGDIDGADSGSGCSAVAAATSTPTPTAVLTQLPGTGGPTSSGGNSWLILILVGLAAFAIGTGVLVYRNRRGASRG